MPSSLHPSMRRQDIAEQLMLLAHPAGIALSRSRAMRLAGKFKFEQQDPELARVLQYADRTGEEAVDNVLFDQRERRALNE